jgi:hypothetical protein
MRISAVNLLMDSVLPPEFQDPFRIYDAKGVDQLLTRIAREQPELYPKIAKLIGDVGRKQAWRRGETFGLEDFEPVLDRSEIWARLQEGEDAVQRLPEKQRAEARAEIYGNLSSELQRQTNTAALARKNNVALTVLTGARGKEAQLRDLISSPGFYADAKGRVVPWFVRHSFAEGLRPHEYLAGTFSARSAITDSKAATAKGGFLAKTLSRALATHYVSTPDCGTNNGLDLEADESDLRGRVLQRETAGFPAGTVLDRRTLTAIRKAKVPKLVVRSPLTCGAENGICSKCYGVMPEGKFPPVGEHVGIRASTALGEPLTQAALRQKHVTSGQASGKEYSGLDFLNQFMESPEEFRDRSAVAPVAGIVGGTREAPQGGSYLRVGDREVYVPTDRQITVKQGEAVEAGDPLTDGLMDVEDVLTHRGLGEARRYWTDRVARMAADSGAAMDRRNFELLSRAVVDHVDLDDPVEEGFLPDDRVRYSKWLHRRNIPKGVEQRDLREAAGRYLEEPALHYTVGTKLTPRMVDHLGKAGWKRVFTSDKEPGFRPTFVRLQQVATTDDDWLASLGGSYLGANLQQGVLRAQDTNIEENTHPVPRMAVGVGYGERIEQTGKF